MTAGPGTGRGPLGLQEALLGLAFDYGVANCGLAVAANETCEIFSVHGGGEQERSY